MMWAVIESTKDDGLARSCYVFNDDEKDRAVAKAVELAMSLNNNMTRSIAERELETGSIECGYNVITMVRVSPPA
jgi:hypothetical protein